MYLPAYWLVLPLAVLAGLLGFAHLAAVTLVVDGLPAALVLAAAAGWGAFPAGRLSAPNAAARLCVAVALGMGWLATATLGLGCAGLLNAVTAWGLVGAGWVAGVWWWQARGERAPASPSGPSPARSEPPTPKSGPPQVPSGRPQARERAADLAVAALLVIPLAVLLFAATLPPGLLWLDEGLGYDVREYHLQAPREYFERGAIEFLPHNVYASFPQQMEVLYLLLMHLTGGPFFAAVPSQLLHAGCAMLAVVAIAAWIPGAAGRRLALLLSGTTPWLTYVGALAYVEAGMLFFAATAGGLLLEVLRARPSQAASAGHAAPTGAAEWRLLAASGVCAGLAGACKYTALVLIAGGLAAAAAVCGAGLAAHGGWRQRAGGLAVFALAAAGAFAPWAARNAAFTGNPVYPFGYTLFGGAAWSPEQDAQWQRGHRPPSDAHTVAGRAGLALRELIGTPAAGEASWRMTLFGVGVIPVGLAGLVLLATRRPAESGLARPGFAEARLAGTWVVVILAAWALLTHLPGRFAVPLIVPLAWAAGWAASGRRAGMVLGVAAGLAGVANGLYLLQHVERHAAHWRAIAQVELATLPGDVELMRSAHLLNQLPDDAFVWLVGDAAPFYLERRCNYTVAFNRDAWIEFSAGRPAADAVAWLQERGVSHVAFAWPEIERLRATYGFAEWVTPAWTAELRAAGMTPAAGEFGPPYEVLATPAAAAR